MIESIMFFGIGFLAASLFGLVLIPLVHNRAVRLTKRRLEAATPLSMAEIQADKDQLRADFAMSTRRLELSVEQMKATTTAQLAELGQKADAINRLKSELAEKSATILTMEEREKSLKDQLQATESEHSVKVGALREAERMLAEKERILAGKEEELATLRANLDERSIAADSQRIEAVSLRAQVDTLKGRITGYERDVNELNDRLTQERKAAAAVTAELDEERGKAEKLADRVTELERALTAQATETEVLDRRAQELESRLTGQTRLLSEREIECSELRDKVEARQKIEGKLRADLAAASSQGRSSTENLVRKNSLIERQLTQSMAECVRLQEEIAGMKREAEQTWGAERVENALLRERINETAAEIARLILALEGKESPIEALLAGAPTTPTDADGSQAGNGENKSPAATGEARSSLADRIRSLRLKAQRIAPPN